MQKFSHTLLLLACCLSLYSSCSYTLPVRDGKTAWELKQYATAIPFLQKEYERADSRMEKGRIAFRLGDSYSRTGQPEKALTWFQTAYQNSFGPEALKGYAYALKQAGRYQEAQEAFKNLGIEIGSPYEYRKEITTCAIAQDWALKADQSGYLIQPTAFNSPQNDYAPVWAPDGRLVFTSDRASSTGKKPYGWTSNKFMDIFIVEPNGASPQAFASNLNSENNEGTLCFNKNGTELYFVRCLPSEKNPIHSCKLFKSSLIDGAWTTPEPLPFQQDQLNYLHPCLSPDGTILYFSCDDPSGWGGFDLYAVMIQPNSETGWGEPKVLSRNLNSGGNELFPNFDADTLYFASDGLPGMGGLDLFRSYKLDKSTWAPAINLKSPLNSSYDDFGMILQPLDPTKPSPTEAGATLRSGYFTSNRLSSDGRGGDDIYYFEQRLLPTPPVVSKDSSPIQFKNILEGYVLEKIYAISTDPNSKVLGRKPLEGATVEIKTNNGKKKINVGPDGYFQLETMDQTDYEFSASRSGYLNNSTRFSSKGLAKDPNNPVQYFEVEIVLDKIFQNQEIVLDNIYYDFDQWSIRTDAMPTLNKLATMLQLNPSINIELGSHTDCRGNDKYNLSLSQRRAESAVEYLVSQGIAYERLSAVGYGEQKPAAQCICKACTEEEHQQNRRTTFTIR